MSAHGERGTGRKFDRGGKGKGKGKGSASASTSTSASQSGKKDGNGKKKKAFFENVPGFKKKRKSVSKKRVASL